jgi:SNF2 family DNA or RNA helicase
MGLINTKIKPIFSKEHRQALANLSNHFSLGNQIEKSWNQFDHEIQMNYQSFWNELFQNELSKIGVNVLNKNSDGIRISVLTNYGITTLLQLSKYSESQLYQIRGIGPTNLNRIINARQREINLIKNQIRVRINPDNRSMVATNLVQSIYNKIINKATFKNVEKVKSTLHPKWYQEYKNAIKLKNTLFWIFRRETSQIIINESAQFILDLSKNAEYITVNQLFKSFFDNMKVNPSISWSHFISNSTFYYAELEKHQNTIQTPLNNYQNNQYKWIDPREQRIQEINKLPENFTGEKNLYLEPEYILKIENTMVSLDLFKSTLRGYQLFGVKFAINSKKILLGDEMGLGKTVEAIALLSHLKSNKTGTSRHLVIVPSSVLINWIKEVDKHSELKSFKLHGKHFNDEIKMWQSKGGVGITTYGHIHKIHAYGELNYDAIILDEAHYVKNHHTKRTQLASHLIKKSEYVLLMTGTPIENNLFEMNKLIGFVNTELSNELANDIFFYKPEIYRHKVAQHYLRRNRKDVLSELPDLMINEEWLEFSPKEKEIYKDAVMSGNFMYMRRVGFMGGDRSNCPKLDRLLEICEEAKINNKKVLIFSFYLEVIDKIKSELGEDAVDTITGAVSSEKRLEIVEEFKNNPKKFFLVSQVMAGGVGLNIQAASIVIIAEPQLKPSIEVQAISRSYRMGQVNDVMVYRLLTEKSIDESLVELLNHKQAIFDAYAKESYLADNSKEAKDISEVNIQKVILSKERARISNENVPETDISA